MSKQRSCPEDSFFEEEKKIVLAIAIVVAIVLHGAVVFGIVAFSSFAGEMSEPEFKTLAIVDFAPYDPSGGEPGGGPMEEPKSSESVPEPPAPPEPVEVPALAQDIVTSTAKEAMEEIPPPPKPEKKKPPQPKPKPKPKPMPKKSSQQKVERLATSPSSGSTGAAQGNSGANNSKGKGKGGSGSGTGQGNPDALNAYYAQIRKKLERYRKYPSVARSRKQEGIVTVSFIVDRQGNVLSSRLVKSSNYRLLNEEVMALMKRVDPFPPAPKEVLKDRFELTMPIRFELK